MTFEQAWQQLVKKKPDLATDSVVEIRASNLRLLLRQFYDQGQKQEKQARDAVRGFEDLLGKNFSGGPFG